jgi:hypothetical protein
LAGGGPDSRGWELINDFGVMKIILNSRHDIWNDIFWDS